jgi:hypothetical protein
LKTAPSVAEQAHLILARQVSESPFQTDVIALAKLRGWLVQHSRTAINKSGKYATPIQGHKGFPDLVLARDGAVIFAELKKVGAYPSADQRRWLETLRSAGLAVYVWRPTDWPEIEAALHDG